MWAGGRMSMERRYELRLEQMLAQAEVSPELMEGLLTRLEEFVEPFAESLVEPEQRRHAVEYMTGLLSNLEHKTAEAIAYLHDRERQGLQKFIGQAAWDHRPLLAELARQVGAELGEPDGVLVFDPSAFPKKGTESVGRAAAVVRPARQGRELPGRRLPRLRLAARARPGRFPALPAQGVGQGPRRGARRPGCPRRSGSAPGTSWPWRCSTSAARRCRTPGSPATTRWAGPSWFRQAVAGAGRALPAGRAVEHAGPRPGRAAAAVLGAAAAGRRCRSCGWTAGARRCRRTPGRRSRCATARRGRWWCRSVEASGAGPDGRPAGTGPEELLVVFRGAAGGRHVEARLPAVQRRRWTTPLAEFARVFKAEHRIEECLKRAKGEAGLADYQVRTWAGWHHHQTLSLLATWFLTQETRRGKNPDPGADGAAGAAADRAA